MPEVTTYISTDQNIFNYVRVTIQHKQKFITLRFAPREIRRRHEYKTSD